MRAKAAELFGRLGAEIDADAQTRRLGLAQQQMVEIAKALLAQVRLLIMDEPTSSLSAKEIETLFRVIRELSSKGVAVVFISHKLDEVFEITDRVVVLRDGENAGSLETARSGPGELISLMVGRELGSFYAERKSRPSTEPLFEARGLSGPPFVEGVSFSVRRGEIFGLAGLIGAGRTETAKLIIGAERPTAGELYLDGERVELKSPKEAMARGVAYLPEDRKTLSLVLGMSVRENVSLAVLGALATRLGLIDRDREEALWRKYVADLEIKLSSGEQAVSSLSGGNQQKVVIAKWLAAEPRLLILDEPTRGIDVHAKSEVHKIIAALADSGVSIILISSELPEVLALSDRLAVMREGRVSRILDRSEATPEIVAAAAFSPA
jgi:ABC-type sugar transport system ATPase subunit